MQTTNSVLTDGEADDEDASSLCYDADVEEYDASPAGTPSPRNSGVHPCQQQISFRSSKPKGRSGCRKNRMHYPKLHPEIDPTLTTVVPSSEFDSAQPSRKRSRRDRKNAKEKKKKTKSSLHSKPNYSGFVSDLEALLLATYREAQEMYAGGSSVEGRRSDDNECGGLDETNRKTFRSGVEERKCEPPIRDNIHDGVNDEGLHSLLASLSTNGTIVLDPICRQLDDVLMSFSGVPRLLLEADAPFRVVHTNAAYQRQARLAPSTTDSEEKDLMEPYEERSTFVFAVRPDPKKCISHYLVELLPNAKIQVVG